MPKPYILIEVVNQYDVGTSYYDTFLDARHAMFNALLTMNGVTKADLYDDDGSMKKEGGRYGHNEDTPFAFELNSAWYQLDTAEEEFTWLIDGPDIDTSIDEDKVKKEFEDEIIDGMHFIEITFSDGVSTLMKSMVEDPTPDECLSALGEQTTFKLKPGEEIKYITDRTEDGYDRLKGQYDLSHLETWPVIM